MLQYSWYYVTSKFTNFTELQYGVAKKQVIIHTHTYLYKMCMPVIRSDWCPQICWYEGKKCCMCQHSSACSLSLPVSEIFHVHSNYAHITGLMPELHNLQFADKRYSPWYPKIIFQQVCECHAFCGNFNDFPSLLNHLLQSYCFHL
jgi:hypothetical protein